MPNCITELRRNSRTSAWRCDCFFNAARVEAFVIPDTESCLSASNGVMEKFVARIPSKDYKASVFRDKDERIYASIVEEGLGIH